MSKFRNASLLQPGEHVTDEQVSTELNILSMQRAANRMSRRGFLATAGLAAGAVGLAGCSSDSSTSNVAPTPTPTTPVAPADVLNFALNLEYLEASFYLTLATGSGLQSADMGSGAGAVTGGLGKVSFTLPGVQDVVNQLAADEQAHVQYLRALITSLGATPVSMPALNLAALGAVTNDATFLALARALETTGTSAYEGAVQFLTSTPAGLTYAAQVHDTEGQHEGVLRQFCIANSIVSPAVDTFDIQPYVANTPPTINIFNTSPTTGLNTSRTTSQVLQIVYGSSGQTGIAKGGFYPNGMNGNITTS